MAQDKPTAAPAAAPSFAPVEASEVPARKGREGTFDMEGAQKLLALVQANPDPGVGDGKVYDTEDDARRAANRARRFLDRVAPAGQGARSRVYTPQGADGKATKGFKFLVTLGTKTPKPPKVAAAK